MEFPKFDKNGQYITNPKYKEIKKLHAMLDDENIPHTFEKFMDGWQLCYPRKGGGCVMDAIEHFGSYGKDEDLLEIMGLLTEEEEQHDSVAGWLTARNVFDRIKSHYEASNQ